MIKDLQALCGFLNFLNKVIFPGRTFTQHMYPKYSGLVDYKAAKNLNDDSHHFKFQQYHHIKLDQEFKKDCQIWLKFLTDDNLAGVVNRKMIDITQPFETSKVIEFYSDASAAKEKGYGCVFNSHWMFGQWEQNYIEKYKPSIEYLKLFALCAGVMT